MFWIRDPGRKQRPASWGRDTGNPTEIPGMSAYGGSCWCGADGQHYTQDPPPSTQEKKKKEAICGLVLSSLGTKPRALAPRPPRDSHRLPTALFTP